LFFVKLSKKTFQTWRCLRVCQQPHHGDRANFSDRYITIYNYYNAYLTN
jgi:hypothetical protein